MRETYVLGVSMTRFGKYLDQSLPDLSYEPIWTAFAIRRWIPTTSTSPSWATPTPG